MKIELAKHPNERMPVLQMIKICKEEFDRLMETSPVIPDKIVKTFQSSFKQSLNFDKIAKPEICDVLISTDMYRNPWYNTENQDKIVQETLKNKLMQDNKQKKIDEMNNSTVKDFKSVFYNLNNREPMESEIIDNLKDKIELTILKTIIEELQMNEV